MTLELYESDYYAWTLDQARRLRGLADDNRIDALNLAEEIEDLGKSELHAVESYVERVLEHLLKIEFSGLRDPVRHWKKEITAFRNRLQDRLTGSLKNRIADTLPRRYWYACQEASKTIEDPRFETRIPVDCPYSLEQVLDESWFPESDSPP